MRNEVSCITSTICHRLLIGVFVITLWLPLIEMLLRFDNALPLNEKRTKAGFPAPPRNLHELWEFKQHFDAFFSDNLGFRNRLVRIHHRLKVVLFGTSPHPRMLIGKDGWLFVNPSRYMNYYRGVNLMNQQDLVGYHDCIVQRSEIVRNKGAIYRLIIAPNKETIYPEFLPKKYHRFNDKARADQLIEVFHESVGSDHIIDLRPAIRKAKEHYPVYFKTDTHWNGAGAFYGYLEVMSRLMPKFFEPQEIQLPSPALQYSGRTVPGDLAIAMGLECAFEDNDITVHNAAAKARRVGVPKTYLNYQRYTGREVVIYENGTVRGNRLVMFHDSFGEGLRPLLAEHFERAVFINRPDMKAFFTEIIQMERPTIVLEEIAEEHLMNPAPEQL
jgi:alginate O-acetyltransferase complex protein AlgJ